MADQYYDFDGTSNSYVYTADHADLDISGDIDIRICARFDVVDATGDTIVGRWDDASTTQQMFTFGCYSGGGTDMWLTWRDSSQVFLNRQSNTGLVASGVDRWYRVTMDVDNGSSQRVITFYYSTQSADTDPALVSWTEHSSHTVSGTTSILTGTQVLSVGNRADGVDEALDGRIYKMQLRNGINGTIVANPDFTVNDQSSGDSTGKNWIAGAAATYVGSQPPTGRSVDIDLANNLVTVTQGR